MKMQEAVLEAARRGFIAEGVELNPTLHIIASIRGYAWWLSQRLRPQASRVASQTLAGGGGVGQRGKGNRWEAARPRFHLGNMFQVQLAPYDVVMVFGGGSWGRFVHVVMRMTVAYPFHTSLSDVSLYLPSGWF